ncbi:CHAT domain-containing protein [Aequorivita xiaoshiensis]|uniref:CHAT domain-containing protein n=1 Tax=Aequorivita xiaoshiensis TaxID=2874476 RepID=A0A9X1QYR1_9FLAO|nr:CHAT domain-containing tetratricopeptide repeat protein [Aequorivita xiaoshiensis]MCG2429595.1 CHAT domain-containing protein [Aequorivita xiaoshiensis]
MKQIVKIIGVFTLLCLLGTVSTYSQKNIRTVSEIQNLINQDSLEKAKTIVKHNIQFYKNNKQYDSLSKYIKLEGSLKLNNGETQQALYKAKQLSDYITLSNNPHYIKIALHELSTVYHNSGQTEKAYNILKQAEAPTSRITDPENTDAASVQYMLGYYKMRIGDYVLAKNYYLKSLALYNKSTTKNYTSFNKVYTALGGILWQESKLDSSKYYFEQALNALNKTDSTDLKNSLFRPSLLKMNMSVLFNAMGKNREAISISYEAIEDFQKFIKTSKDEHAVKQAKGFVFSTLDNLGSYYNTLGEFKRTEEILEYSYALKQKEYEENDMNLIISHIILTQAKTTNQNFKDAELHLKKAVDYYKNNEVVDSFWKASAYSVGGTLYEEMGDLEKAKFYYEEGDRIYRKISQGRYSVDNLDRIIHLSKFYVKIGEKEKAISAAEEAYKYSRNNSLKNTLQEFFQLQNLAIVHFKLKNYKKSLEYSEKAIAFNLLNKAEEIGTADSIVIQYRKPTAILTNVASKYHLSKNRTTADLKQYKTELNKAISILEQRKKVVNNYDDLTILNKENNELFNFAKKILLELYQNTKDDFYLDQAISLHESAIYNRIRSRLNIRDNIAFQNVPIEIIEKEKLLKNDISKTLEKNNADVKTYISASEKWELFMKKLQKDYPTYYKMRYETLEEPIKDLQEKISENTTVIRYLFIEDKLNAFVVSRSKKHIFLLNNSTLETKVEELTIEDFSVERKSALLHDLYKMLWKPLEKSIKTKKVVVIPDRELFNISFEMLTPESIKSFKEFSTNSLLAKYDISYNFSLLLYKDNRKVMDYNENYVGFAPGFNKDMKQEYLLGLQDSMKLDKSYLTLLPQPFSENLVKQYAKVFKGNYFMNENASKALFINNAKEHKIIHIGTHAESDNITPELSRLVFAKRKGKNLALDENSLYAYEIYNTNLSSNLAILTACETGKSIYQSGEGAISLAHAFNYAGSESILTSLWNIDEVSSTQIVAYFYDYLVQGLPKDEALKKAKIQYLSSVEGRGAAPQYWAGLVLIGDTTPIVLQENTDHTWWWVTGILLTFAILIFFYKNRKDRNHNT